MGQPSFLTERGCRNGLRAATLYAAGAWRVVQVATQVSPFFGIENWMVRWIVVAAVIGSPFAMAFSWFYEWTPRGIVRESEVAANASVTRETSKKLDCWIIAVLSLADIHTLRGDADQAFPWLDRGVAKRDPGASALYEDPFIVPALRKDPRLAAISRKIGLPDPGTVPDPWARKP